MKNKINAYLIFFSNILIIYYYALKKVTTPLNYNTIGYVDYFKSKSPKPNNIVNIYTFFIISNLNFFYDEF